MAALALVLGAQAVRGIAPPPSPRVELQRAIDGVLATLREPRFKTATERRRELERIIDQRFDFGEMGRRALGRHWQSRTPAERQEFIEAFREVLLNTYLTTIESYRGEKVRFVRERVNDRYAEVDTVIVGDNGQEYSVNYRLHLAGDDWKIYDAVIEGVSLVSNYRSQFNRVLERESFEQLLKRMRGSLPQPPAAARK